MSKTGNDDEHRTVVARIWAWLWRPSVRYSLGAIFVVGGIAGILFWSGFHLAVELSNTETFCVSCHEMRDNVFKELKKTVHYSNASGVRATCSDCHVPKQLGYKLVRKVQATNELFHKIIGSINTREKFKAARIELAKNVWASMKETDSRECRNCHRMDFMKMEDQARPARNKHSQGQEEGKTCIDCHQGIAHELPDDWEADYAALMVEEFGEVADTEEVAEW